MGTIGGIIGMTKILDTYNGLLIEADIALNIAHPLANDPIAPTSYSVKTLVTHEFGHLIGLGESQLAFSQAIMAPKMPTGQSAYNLRQDDIDGYNHIAW